MCPSLKITSETTNGGLILLCMYVPPFSIPNCPCLGSTSNVDFNLFVFKNINLFYVLVIPHITDAIQEWVERVAKQPVSDDGVEPDVRLIIIII